MDTMFMNSENSKTSDPQTLKKVINMLLYQILSFKTWKNIKKSYKDNKSKISAPAWNAKFELLDESYSIPDIQDYFEYILKNMEKRLIILL